MISHSGIVLFSKTAIRQLLLKTNQKVPLSKYIL